MMPVAIGNIFARSRFVAVELLEDKADALLPGVGGKGGDWGLIEVDRAAGWLIESGQQFDQRAFAGAIGPHNRHGFPRLQSERDLL